MRNKSNLLILLLIVCSILSLSLAGCSSSETNTSATPPSSAASSSTAPVSSTSPTPTDTTPTPSVTQTPSATPTTVISSPTPSSAVELGIAAAASLTDALKAINALYVQGKPNVTLTPSFASSGTLQTQIENGAPVDIFISAASTQMDNLQKGGLILNDTHKNLLNNKVVLIVPLDSTLGLTSFSDLAADKVKKVAIGDPKSVPAGIYATQAFDELGITAQIQPKEVLGADVRTVLTYVESGNVDAGIVYSTDALTSTKVKVVAGAPADINAKVVYPVAVIKTSKNPDAATEYINFLFSAQAKTVFEKYGFTLVVN
jgi:molybdate transport system substrate-binding protein